MSDLQGMESAVSGKAQRLYYGAVREEIRMIRIGTFAVALVMLAACSTTGVFPSQSGKPWNDVDETGVPLGKGAKECKYQAMVGSASATGVSKQSDVAGDLYEQCMHNRGY
jgi:hypothetical protein